jgi:translation elongation factor EF-G
VPLRDRRHLRQPVDTPGIPDFIGRSLSVLEAVETAAVVVSAVTGIEPMTERMMDFARDRGLCRLVIVNRIDAPEARPEAVLAELRERFGKECLPLNLPAAGGKEVVDVFFQPTGRDTDFSSVAAAHTEIIDQVVEVDEDLMAVYLEQGEELEARAAARSLRGVPARGAPHTGVLRVGRDGRGHPGAARRPRAADAEPGRGQSAAVPEGRGRRTRCASR